MFHIQLAIRRMMQGMYILGLFIRRMSLLYVLSSDDEFLIKSMQIQTGTITSSVAARNPKGLV